MIVLSLFDGMSCGRVALERAGLKPSVYYASEIDKHAVKVAQKNFPDTIQIGDVRGVKAMIESGFLGKIDMLIGGSPCQGFSFAGKQLAFDDPRSSLFFEYVEILKAIQKVNPDVKFLLENVRMKKRHLDVISTFLGVEPVCINSALVNAQNRVRYYWCNWPVSQPEDKGVMLKYIVDWGLDQRQSESWHEWFEKNKEFQLRKKYSAVVNDEEKAITFTARQYASWNGNFVRLPKVTGCRMVGRKINPSTGKRDDYNENLVAAQRIETRVGGKAGCLTTVRKDSLACIDADEIYYRKFTPVECERLMGLPDGYTEGVSNTQRYKMCGNGWETNTVTHIFLEYARSLCS